MKYTDLKIGDTITILSKPRMWNSHLCNNSPMDITFPYTGIVYKVGAKNWPEAAHIGDYGWSLDYIKDFKILNQTYEIY